MQLQQPNIDLLSRAFFGSNVIVDVKVVFWNRNQDEQIVFLRKTLGPNSIIKSFSIYFHDYPSSENATAIGDIISSNTSLVSLVIEGYSVYDTEDMLPVLQGVVNSVRNGVITSSDIKDWRRSKDERQIQMIGEMVNLKFFSFRLHNFRDVPADIINENLKRLHLLDRLEIVFDEGFDGIFSTKLPVTLGVLQTISSWDKKCKIHVHISIKGRYYCLGHLSKFLSALDGVTLEKFTAQIKHYNSHNTDLDLISEHIPNWKFLKELELVIRRLSEEDQHLEFAAAVRKNASLEKLLVKIEYKPRGLYRDAQLIIDRALERNILFAKSIATPSKVPDWQWPTLLELANEVVLLDLKFQLVKLFFEKNANNILETHPASKAQQMVKETRPSNKSSTLFASSSYSDLEKSNDNAGKTTTTTSATKETNNINNISESIMPMKRNDHSVKENVANINETNDKLGDNEISSKQMKLQFDAAANTSK